MRGNAAEKQSKSIRAGEEDARKFDFKPVPRSAPRTQLPYITISHQKRRLSMNHAATLLFGRPEAVELVYDEKQHVLGIQPASLTSPYALKSSNRGTEDTSRAFGLVFSASALIIVPGLKGPGTFRYDVEMFEGKMIADLSKPAESFRKPRRASVPKPPGIGTSGSKG